MEVITLDYPRNSLIEVNSLPSRMATSSTPGGNIPNFIVQKSTPGQVANDVPMFLKWLHSDREYFKNGIEGSREEPEAPLPAEQPAQ